MKTKVFAFDVFGTVVDWRTSIAREAAPLLSGTGIDPYASPISGARAISPRCRRAAMGRGLIPGSTC